jgi:anaerobic magnesium-protoporphyrin IX monomethyl ester cyclase
MQRTLLLIDPPYYRLFDESYGLARYPLSLGYLAGTVRRDTGWKVVAYNADFLPRPQAVRVRHLSGKGFCRYLDALKDGSQAIWRQVQRTIERYRPGVVGISCKSQTFASAVRVARLAKSSDPGTLVIAGGPHPSMVGRDVLAAPEIDIAVRGEGEAILVDLLAALESGRSLESVAGIYFRKGGTVVETGPAPSIENLDNLCFPHESAPDVLHEYEQYPPDAFSHVFATRGCPYNCFFCGSRNVWGHRVRFRSADNVVREIQSLQKRGVDAVHFDDDTFGIHTRHIRRLCDAVKTGCPGLRWSCELHVKLVTDEHIRLMKEAGCYSIQLGIESGNDAILAAIRKEFTIAEALEAVDMIRRHGVDLQAFFMVGFPQETMGSLTDTVSAMKKISGRLSYSIFTPYPGTEAFDFCRDHGLIDGRFDVSLYNHQSPENCFCLNISREEFRARMSKVERMVDRNNYPGFVRRIRKAISVHGKR